MREVALSGVHAGGRELGLFEVRGVHGGWRRGELCAGWR